MYFSCSTLLELGASPNYRDGRGITPLYISITRKCEAKITESLLHDHATLGIQDSQGWNEVHQVKSVADLSSPPLALSLPQSTPLPLLVDALVMGEMNYDKIDANDEISHCFLSLLSLFHNIYYVYVLN